MQILFVYYYLNKADSGIIERFALFCRRLGSFFPEDSLTENSFISAILVLIIHEAYLSMGHCVPRVSR